MGEKMKSVRKIMLSFMMLTVVLFMATVNVSAGHKHSYAKLYTVKPTCTQKGYTVYSCKCGKAYNGSEKKAYGHSFSKDVVCFKKSTCTEKGKAGRFCTRCNAKTDTVYLDKISHSYKNVTLKATTKKNGQTRKECTSCKKVTKVTEISKISSIKIERKTYTYDGKAKSPSVKITDAKGKALALNKDYTLKYQSGRKKPGIYTVKVTFKGNYTGNKTLKFTVKPAAVRNITSLPSVTAVDLYWDEPKGGADGYEIYLKSDKLKLIYDTEKTSDTVKKINGKALKSGTEYTFVIKAYKDIENKKIYSSEKKVTFTTKPEKGKINKVTYSKKKAKVKITKQNCHGYELLISTNKSFSNPEKVVLKSKNKTEYTFDKLKSNKRYFVKVRAYVVSGGEKYYGNYSDVKTFKT